MATKQSGPNFLSREEIDSILQGMTARDLFAAMPSASGLEQAPAETAGRTFELAAERQGYGAGALDRVKIGDAVYLSTELGGVMSADSPKAEDTES